MSRVSRLIPRSLCTEQKTYSREKGGTRRDTRDNPIFTGVFVMGTRGERARINRIGHLPASP